MYLDLTPRLRPHRTQDRLGKGGDHAVRHPGHPADVPLPVQHQRGHGAFLQGRLLEVLLLYMHEEAEETQTAERSPGVSPLWLILA